jgi:hypothetical protein
MTESHVSGPLAGRVAVVTGAARGIDIAAPVSDILVLGRRR